MCVCVCVCVCECVSVCGEGWLPGRSTTKLSELSLREKLGVGGDGVAIHTAGCWPHRAWGGVFPANSWHGNHVGGGMRGWVEGEVVGGVEGGLGRVGEESDAVEGGGLGRGV